MKNFVYGWADPPPGLRKRVKRCLIKGLCPHFVYGGADPPPGLLVLDGLTMGQPIY